MVIYQAMKKDVSRTKIINKIACIGPICIVHKRYVLAEKVK